MTANVKITSQNAAQIVLSSAFLITIWISLLGHPPITGAKNPPYHHFGAFDFGYWWAGWAIYGGQMIAALTLYRSKYGYRPILKFVITILTVCIAIHVWFFIVALGQPTL